MTYLGRFGRDKSGIIITRREREREREKLGVELLRGIKGEGWIKRERWEELEIGGMQKVFE